MDTLSDNTPSMERTMIQEPQLSNVAEDARVSEDGFRAGLHALCGYSRR